MTNNAVCENLNRPVLFRDYSLIRPNEFILSILMEFKILTVENESL